MFDGSNHLPSLSRNPNPKAERRETFKQNVGGGHVDILCPLVGTAWLTSKAHAARRELSETNARSRRVRTELATLRIDLATIIRDFAKTGCHPIARAGSPARAQFVQDRRRWAKAASLNRFPGGRQRFVQSAPLIFGEVIAFVDDHQVDNCPLGESCGLVENESALLDARSKAAHVPTVRVPKCPASAQVARRNHQSGGADNQNRFATRVRIPKGRGETCTRQRFRFLLTSRCCSLPPGKGHFPAGT
jgi:hypothetical protein